MPDQLLATKFFVPPTPPALVRRPRLLARLDEGLNQRRSLSLVSAPAGYGKTTLVSEWLNYLGWDCAWLTLDRGDNHLAQFLAYFAAALGRVDARLGAVLQETLSERPPPEAGLAPEWLEGLLVTLINEAAGLSRPFLLVLDDYHVITELAVHRAVGYLIEHLPPLTGGASRPGTPEGCKGSQWGGMHVVLTTRADPLLPLARLRARGRLTEIRSLDLRFTREETLAFLNDCMDLQLADDEIGTLAARTEGWIAGLQLAALSLAQLPPPAGVPGAAPLSSGNAADRARFIQAFAGDDRHIMDYLGDEVISRQPAGVQRFLLRTAVLGRLSGPLCDALMGEPWELGQSQRILEQLERSNLFIIPLDHRREWYRYHHLFADLLRHRLQQTQPDLAPLLHRRASEWLEAAGLLAEAVEHALLTEDLGRAGRLIEHAGRAAIWTNGELQTLQRWSDRLPEDELKTRPRLCLYYARAVLFSGDVAASQRYLRQAKQAIRSQVARGDEPGQRELWGLLFLNRATLEAMRGDDPGQALALAERAAGCLPEGDQSAQARLAHARGVAHELLGDVAEAGRQFSLSWSLALAAGNRNLGLDVAACLARVHMAAGEPVAAIQVCEQALAGALNAGGPWPPACAVYAALAEALHMQGECSRAEEAVARSIEFARRAGWPHVLWEAYVTLANIHQTQGDRAGAVAAIEQARQVAARYAIPRVQKRIAAARARLALAWGNLAAAAAWAEDYRRAPNTAYLREYEDLTLARVLLAEGQSAEALALLDEIQAAAEAAGRGRTVAEARSLRGQPGAPSARPSPSQQPLLEPLSERELEVLRLIADGLSNPEIAGRLYLSPNTMRAHTYNIYGKLEVHSRTQAVARARALGLLPGG